MEIEKLIEEKNLKLTSARKELLEIFFSAKKPLSFEDVKDKVSMDKATFYRNISKFESESILKSFESNDKKRYYELQKSPHTHFICNICNNIECIDNLFDVRIDGYIIEDLILKGVCKKCKT
ncbi:transcriptional repressor [Sulfurimonas lithotrophica]|uniref:Transcriptional repressor n=1 Tax=Sulfurimonas lithotrophica TaxID=2590022 RepID=A0A5P8NYC6_9BACT|nr:transcriptional repressor [Sulfurimonas lithotrophica]QFR48404.1 transcriptional repressor [Sulfurimonas lithotrophica]